MGELHIHRPPELKADWYTDRLNTFGTLVEMAHKLMSARLQRTQATAAAASLEAQAPPALAKLEAEVDSLKANQEKLMTELAEIKAILGTFAAAVGGQAAAANGDGSGN